MRDDRLRVRLSLSPCHLRPCSPTGGRGGGEVKVSWLPSAGKKKETESGAEFVRSVP